MLDGKDWPGAPAPYSDVRLHTAVIMKTAEAPRNQRKTQKNKSQRDAVHREYFNNQELQHLGLLEKIIMQNLGSVGKTTELPFLSEIRVLNHPLVFGSKIKADLDQAGNTVLVTHRSEWLYMISGDCLN